MKEVLTNDKRSIRDKVKYEVYDIFETVYVERPTLKSIPGDFDIEPEAFFEMLIERFNLEKSIIDKMYTSNVKKTIDIIEREWNGDKK
jgi:hypothetical protein